MKLVYFCMYLWESRDTHANQTIHLSLREHILIIQVSEEPKCTITHRVSKINPQEHKYRKRWVHSPLISITHIKCRSTVQLQRRRSRENKTRRKMMSHRREQEDDVDVDRVAQLLRCSRGWRIDCELPPPSEVPFPPPFPPTPPVPPPLLPPLLPELFAERRRRPLSSPCSFFSSPLPEISTRLLSFKLAAVICPASSSLVYI